MRKQFMKRGLSLLLATAMALGSLQLPTFTNEVEAATPTTNNVALGKPVTAGNMDGSSVAVNTTGGPLLSNLTDGGRRMHADDYTEIGYAATETVEGISYLQVNLGMVYDISGVNLLRYFDGRTYGETVIAVGVNESDFPENPTDSEHNAKVIFYTDEPDKNYFEQCFGTPLQETYPENSGDGYTVTLDRTVKGQFVRIYCVGRTYTNNAGNTVYNNRSHVVELEVYKAPDSISTEAMTVTASGTYQLSGGEAGEENYTNISSDELKDVIFDENATTFWNSNHVAVIENENPYLKIDLGGLYNLTQVSYTPHWGETEAWECTGNIQKLVVEVSYDGTTWRQVSEEDGVDLTEKISSNDELQFPVKVTFDENYVKYVRISGVASYDDNTSISIGDLAIYGLEMPPTNNYLMAGSVPASTSTVTTEQPFAAGTANSNIFRIPCLITLNNGNLLAAADARYVEYRDFGGIDTIASVSTDNGATWNYSFPINFPDSDGSAGTNASSATKGMATTSIDPVIVQGMDGTIYCLADMNPSGITTADVNPGVGTGFVTIGEAERLPLTSKHANASIKPTDEDKTTYEYYVGDFDASGFARVLKRSDNSPTEYAVDEWYNIYQVEGKNYLPLLQKQVDSDAWVQQNVFYKDSILHVYNTGYIWLVTSQDGMTWGNPQILNPQIKRDNETALLVSPGRGMVTNEGDIVIGAYNTVDGEDASVFYLKNGSSSWKRSANDVVAAKSSENEIVELYDGTLRMFYRSNEMKMCYADITKDSNGDYVMGTGVALDIAIRSNCNVTAIKLEKSNYAGRPIVLVAAPEGPGGRVKGRIFAFAINPNNSMELLNTYRFNEEAYAYSCLTELNTGDIGLLWEPGNDQLAAVRYSKVTLKDIVPNITKDLWVSDNAGQPVESISMRVRESKTLNVGGTLLNDTNTPVITWTATEVATVTQNGTSLTIVPVNAGKGNLTVTDGTNTIVIPIEIVTTTNREPVELKIGETKEYTDNSGYYVGTEVVEDARVAGVKLTGNANYSQLMTGLADDATFADSLELLENSQYAFVPVDNKTYEISAVAGKGTANEQVVYLHHRQGDTNPNMTTWSNITIIEDNTTANVTDDFKLQDNGSGGSQYLGFIYDSKTYGRTTGERANHHDSSFELFKKADDVQDGQLIPGYEKVTSLEGVKAGGEYLIAHKGKTNADSDVYYLLYPSSSTSANYAHVAKVVGSEVCLATSAGNFDTTKTVSIDDCLYKFSTLKYKVGSETQDGASVGLKVNGNNGYPNQQITESNPQSTITVTVTSNGTFTLKDASYLHFHKEIEGTNALKFNQCGNACANDKMEIYVKSENAPANSPIPGYLKITSLRDFSGSSSYEYLIASQGKDNAYYILHPSKSTTDKYAHVAKVVGFREITVKPGSSAPSNVVQFDGTATAVSNLLYTFKKATDENGNEGYHIYTEDENGNPRLYLSLRNTDTGTKPHQSAEDENLSVIQLEQKTVGDTTYTILKDASGYVPRLSRNAGAYFHFHSTNYNKQSGKHHFDRCESVADADVKNHAYLFYAKVEDGYESSSEIPGYKQVSASEIQDGGKYLIVFNDEGTLYFVNPPESDTSSADKHVALLGQEYVEAANGTTKIAITGKKAGYTEAIVGDTTYQITVQSADINVTVLRGENYTMAGALEGEATNAGIVDLMSGALKAPYTIKNSLTSGEVYLIGRTLTGSDAHKCVIMNELNGNSIRMTNNANFESGDYGNYAWRVTAVDGVENGYTLQNVANGKYFAFNGTNIQLKDEAQTVIIREATNGRFYIVNNDNSTIYLHDTSWLSGHTQAAGYASDGDGSKWNFYQGTSGVQATGKNLGSTTVRVGGVNYIITVADVVNYQALEEITNYVTTSNLLTDTAYTQTSRNALDTVVKEAKAMLSAKDTTKYTDETVLNTKQAEVEAMTKKVNDAVKALQKANESITLLEGKSEVVKVTAATVTKMPDTDVATVDVKTKDGIHEMTITGVNSGVTEVVIGDNTYKIYVLENPETTKVIANTGQGTGLPVNRLTISADVAFDLNIKDDEAATFSIEPVYAADGTTNIVEISEDGVIRVTDLSAVTTVRETVVTVTVGEEVFKVPVYIRPGATASVKKTIDLHITEIKNTEVYYSWDCSTDLTHGYVGETFLVKYDSNQRYALDFMGAPYEGHALTQMLRENENQSSSSGHYMLVHTGDRQTLNTTNEGFLHYPGGAGEAQSGMYGRETVEKMLYAGMAKGVDGIFGFTRKAGNNTDNTYNLTFRSEKLPTIEKEVAGLLPQDGKVGEYRKYTEGMTGAEGEYVYFKVNVKSYRPLELNAEKKSNITYSNMKITDTALASASFVTPEFDANGNLVNVDADDMNPTTIVQQITDEINAAVSADVWSDENEETKDHVYYLVYKIDSKDVGKTIENTALLDYQYTSHYSKGVYDVSAQAAAEVAVSDYKTKDIVVDFGLPVTVHIATWGIDGVASDKLLTGEGVGKASYGKVDVAGDREQGWTITYTPTSVLQGVDNVVLTAEDGVTKYSIKVYPANSVYYEGSFMSEVSGTWETKGYLPTGLQQTAELGDAGKGNASNYGYDAIYAEELTAPAVTVRSGSTVKDIKECLYTFENTGRTYTLDGKDYPIYDISAINADGTKVYLNVGKASQSGNQSPNQLDSTGMIVANRGEQLLSIIGINLPTGISDTTRAYLHCTYDGPHFDRCSTDPSDHANNHAFELYQYTGNQDDGLVIPGYERVSDGSKIKHGEQYLIVFKRPDNDTRYVLHPASGTTANDFTNGNKARSVATLTGTITSDTSNTGTAMTTTNADASGAFADSLANAETTFTFTGTGVDLYAHCTKDTGIAMVIITQKNANGKDKIAKVMMVDTQLRTGSVDTAAGLDKIGMTNNVPFVSLPANSLTYGTYEVAIVHATSKEEQNSGQVDENGKEIKTRVSVPTKLKLDGFRVYGTLTAADEARYYAGDREAGMLYKDVRDALMVAWNVGNAWNKEDDKSVYAEQLAKNTLSQIYAATGQQLTGAYLLDGTGQQMAYTGAALKDYLDNSSKNEVYLYPGQSLVFTLEASNVNPQIALKSLNGSVQYTMTTGASDSTAVITTPAPQTMRSNTEMYYPLAMGEAEGNPVNTTFTITNAGTSGVLAITKLKAIDANGAVEFAKVTEKDLTMALISLGFKSEAQQPEVTVEPTITEAPEVSATPEVTEAPETTEEPTETPDSGVDVTKVFSDVHKDWYTDYVSFVYANGLMTGIKGTTEFQPDANITKAQVAQVLYNMENKPLPLHDEVFHVLSDVYDSEWYADAVSWAYSTGIVTGDLNTKKFSPNADVTREQLALMMYRYADHKNYAVDQTSDLAGLENADLVADWSETAVRWAVGSGLISGIEKDGVKDLAPQGNATRAQMAAILQRFCENCK